MSIAVAAAFSIIDNCIIEEEAVPRRFRFQPGAVIGVLTNFRERGSSPPWTVEIRLSLEKPQIVTMPVEQCLTAEEYESSKGEPFCFAPLAIHLPPDETTKVARDLSWLWLFHDVFYVCERLPRPSEMEEVILRIKALHYERAQEFRRLREQVANYEAVETLLKSGRRRETIPDDVKLLVWSRDAGACVKCGAQAGLQFDHIIPHSRGGSDGADNLQLLCDRCNLSKSDRLV